MESIQELLRRLCKCIVKSDDGLNYIIISKQESPEPGPDPDPPTPPEPEKPDLDTFDPNVPFCIENVGDVQANVQYNTKNINIRISKDYKTWNDYTPGTEIELNPKDRVYIKSDYVKDTGYDPRFVFNGDGARLRARGNIASLIYGTNDAYVSKYTSTEEYCYFCMFDGCTGLTQAPELPAMTLAPVCYNSMFNGCTSLTKAPELPAMTLANGCYNSMFYGCTSLTKAPELPATTLADECYNSMFNGCTSLTQAPELPATTLVTRCYYDMFRYCTKLNYVKCLATDTSATNCMTNWLANVSTTGAFECDNKKYFTIDSPNGVPTGWTITEINPDPPTPPEPEKPDLDTFDPNVPFCIENVGDVPVEIGLYNVGTEAIRAKRSNCKISTDLVTWSDYNILLTKSSTDPNISKITLSNKGDRIYIKADVNTKATGSDFTKLIVINQSTDTKIIARGNIASLTYGTDDLYKSKYLTIDNHSCYSYMFAGCASLTQAPDLPATTLYISCYERMFQNCANLKQAPELPATTLETNCYYWMFRSCKKLNYVKCLATDISAIGCTTGFLELVASTGDFYTPASTNWTTGEYGIPTGWTRHDIT